MSSTQTTKIETLRGPVFAKKTSADGEYQAIRRRGPVYLLLASLALSVPLTAVSLSFADAVVAQERMRASDIVGTWKGTDGREYTIESSLQGQVSLRIKGPETAVKPIVEGSTTLTLTFIGAETFRGLEYTGKFEATGFTVKARLSFKKNFPQNIDNSGSVFSRLSKKHPVIYNFITFKFVDKNTITIQRSLSKIKFATNGSKTEMTPLFKIETATLTKDGADPKSPTDSANLGAQDDKRVAKSEKDQEKEPDVFFCYRDDQFAKVTEDTPCAKSAQQWLDGYDNGIGALRNLLAVVPDLSSEAAKTSKAELKRHRKEKAQLLEAIKREAEVAKQANDNAKPAAAAAPLDKVLEGVTHEETANSTDKNPSSAGSNKPTGGFRVSHSVIGSVGYEEMTNAAGVVVQRKTIDRSTQKLTTLDLSDRFHPDGQVARVVQHTFSPSGSVSSEVTTFAPNGDYLHRATIHSATGEWSLNKWNPKTRKFEPRDSKRVKPQDIPRFTWDPALMKWTHKK